MMEYLILFFSTLIIFYMGVVILSYGFLLLSALKKLCIEYRLDKVELDEESLMDKKMKPVSIIIPAYNEEQGVIDSIHS
ncbi:hypothetical protein ACEK07_36260, partial [Alcanivoracaceae bacterium MT1]